jgi:hypothetical protein
MIIIWYFIIIINKNLGVIIKHFYSKVYILIIFLDYIFILYGVYYFKISLYQQIEIRKILLLILNFIG